MNRTTRSLTMLAAAAALGACADATTAPVASSGPRAASAWMTPGGEQATVHIGDFSKSPVLAMGMAHGFFADENLTVTEEQTPSSPIIFTNLRSGKWQVILTQIDNVFNYRYNASNPLGSTFEPVAFGGTD